MKSDPSDYSSDSETNDKEASNTIASRLSRKLNITVPPHHDDAVFVRDQDGSTHIQVRSSAWTDPSIPASAPAIASAPAMRIATKSRLISGLYTPQITGIHRFRGPVRGHVVALSMENQGCRLLQKCLDAGGLPIFELIFTEIVKEIKLVAGHHTGNYLVQKLLDKCSKDERLDILCRLQNDLVDMTMSPHGTRVVQKLIALCSTTDETDIITKELRPSLCEIAIDNNGNHCVQSFLQADARFSAYGWVLDDIADNCIKLTTHRTGCCIYQRCMDLASPEKRQLLASKVLDNLLFLVVDPCGNYVVQHVLNHGDRAISRTIIQRLIGSITTLATMKFSSNVVEKCLQLADQELLDEIFKEMCSPEQLPSLLCDPYGNYCIQSLLSVCQAWPEKFDELVRLIRLHVHLLEKTIFRRRIYIKMMNKFPVLYVEDSCIAQADRT